MVLKERSHISYAPTDTSGLNSDALANFISSHGLPTASMETNGTNLSIGMMYSTSISNNRDLLGSPNLRNEPVQIEPTNEDVLHLDGWIPYLGREVEKISGQTVFFSSKNDEVDFWIPVPDLDFELMDKIVDKVLELEELLENDGLITLDFHTLLMNGRSIAELVPTGAHKAVPAS